MGRNDRNDFDRDRFRDRNDCCDRRDDRDDRHRHHRRRRRNVGLFIGFPVRFR